jgi:hypothetical protein
MEAIPTESETILESEIATKEPEPPTDPVTEFKKGKAKREAKRKEVKVITEYVPEPPEPAPTPLSGAVEIPDAESIASRAAELLFAKISAQQNVMDKTPEVKTKAKPKPPAKKKDQSPPPPPPPTNYFGWC